MFKKIKNALKRFRYIYVRKSIVQFGVISKKVKSLFINHRKLDLHFLNIDKLPFPVRWEKIFTYKNLIVEIGSGHGEVLKELASQNSENQYIGFEITTRFTRKSAKVIKGLKNALIFKGDAYFSTLNLFADSSINKIYVLFPDPWHKKKHHKRRPLNRVWFRDISKKLSQDGEIFFATDWEEYFQYVKKELQQCEDLYTIQEGEYVPTDHNLPPTHYYKKWVQEKRNFNYLSIVKK